LLTRYLQNLTKMDRCYI